MHCPLFNNPQAINQRGAALVIALLVSALSAALVTAMASEFLLFYQRGSNVFVSEQSYAYLRGAEELASIALILDHDQDNTRESPRDDLTELWAEPTAPYPLDEGGWLRGDLEDLQGRFNLNTLGTQINSDKRDQYTPAQQQFIRLLQALPELDLGRDEATIITRSVSDWLDADGNVAPNGAEDDFYFGQSPAYRTANAPMFSVSELRAVANITPEIYAALAPWVAALPETDSVMNIHTAPRPLLRTLNEDGDLQPLSESDAEALIAHRCSPGFADKADFLEHAVFSGKEKKEEIGDLIGETSSYYLLSANVEVAERLTRLYSVLEREGRAVNIVSRVTGGVYPKSDLVEKDRCSSAQ